MFDFLVNVLKLWRESSNRQRIGLVFFVVVIFLGIVLFEKWTAAFRLSRLDRSASILQIVSQVPEVNTNAVSAIAHSITTQLSAIVGCSQKETQGHSLFVRYLVSLIPWCFLGVIIYISVHRKDRSEISGVYGVLGFGVFFSFLAMLLPEGKWPWTHIAIYPILFFAVIIGLTMIFASSHGTKGSSKTSGSPKDSK